MKPVCLSKLKILGANFCVRNSLFGLYRLNFFLNHTILNSQYKYSNEAVMVRVMVSNTTFNNISVISWRSVLLMEETRVPRENHRTAASNWKLYNIMLQFYWWRTSRVPRENHRSTACRWQKLSHNVVSSTHLAMSGIRTLVVIGTDCTGSWIIQLPYNHDISTHYPIF